MKIKYLISIGSLLIISTCGLLYYNYITSPTYSLFQIRKAYEMHDITAFEKYVDIKTLTGRLLTEALNSVNIENEASEAEKLGHDLAESIVTIMRPQIEEVWRQQILRLVETGESEKKDDKGFKEYWNKHENVYARNVIGTKEEGMMSTIDLEMFYPRFDTSLVLTVKLRDKGNYWQAFDVPNVKTFTNKLDSLEDKRISDLNAIARKEIEKTFEASKITLNIQTSGYYYIMRHLYYVIEFQNIGDKKIKDIDLLFRLVDSGGKYIDTNYLSESNISLIPGEKHIKADRKYLSDDDRFSLEKPRVEISQGKITFDDNTMIVWHTAWEKNEDNDQSP